MRLASLMRSLEEVISLRGDLLLSRTGLPQQKPSSPERDGACDTGCDQGLIAVEPELEAPPTRWVFAVSSAGETGQA